MSQPAKELKELIAEVKKSYEEITRLKVENKKLKEEVSDLKNKLRHKGAG